MTAAELIEKLKQLPPDLDVTVSSPFSCWECGGGGDAKSVRLDEFAGGDREITITWGNR